MLNEPKANKVSATPSGAGEPWPRLGSAANPPRYAHIVVPTSLSHGDRAALQLGVQLAEAHGAALTVLHVAPPRESRRMAEGLDAIGLLHSAAHDLNTRGSLRRREEGLEAVRQQARQFIETELPGRLEDESEFCLVCRTGEIAEEIARHAGETDADLVILSSRPPRRWLPLLSGRVRRILQRSPSPVIVVARPAGARKKLVFHR